MAVGLVVTGVTSGLFSLFL